MKCTLDELASGMIQLDMEQALNRACLLVENEARKNCPVGLTGELRRSITHRVEGDTGYVYTNIDDLLCLPHEEHIRIHVNDPEYHKRLSESHKGIPHTEELNRKISEAKKGVPMSDELKKQISETLKGKYVGELNPFYGKHHSDETRAKLVESHTGKHLAEKSKAKLSQLYKGTHYYNNGEKEVRLMECPEGFVPGRLYKRKQTEDEHDCTR